MLFPCGKWFAHNFSFMFLFFRWFAGDLQILQKKTHYQYHHLASFPISSPESLMKASSFRRRHSCFESWDFQVAPRNAPRCSRFQSRSMSRRPKRWRRRWQSCQRRTAPSCNKRFIWCWDERKLWKTLKNAIGTSDFIDFDVWNSLTWLELPN